MSVSVAAHAVDRAGGAGADGVGVATRMFGGDGDGTIRAAANGTFVVKRIVLAEVNDETDALGTGRKRYGGAHLNAESFVGLGVGDARFRGCVVVSAAPDVDGARRGNRAASVGLSTKACGIGRGANVILDVRLGLLANVDTSHEKRQDEQTGDS